MSAKDKKQELDPKKLKKGQLLVVKVPPFFDREYIYQISGAGGKIIRADLYHSPRVKKKWTCDDLSLLFENGMIRFAEESDLQNITKSVIQSDENSSDSD